MTAVVVAGLTGWHLVVIAVLVVSALASATYATRKQKSRLAAAVAGHWETTPQGTRVWRGTDFVRPRATDPQPVPEGGAK